MLLLTKIVQNTYIIYTYGNIRLDCPRMQDKILIGTDRLETLPFQISIDAYTQNEHANA